jgi:hypothetical protein
VPQLDPQTKLLLDLSSELRTRVKARHPRVPAKNLVISVCSDGLPLCSVVGKGKAYRLPDRAVLG